MPLKYLRVTPSIPVSSLQASIDFYTEKLGFRISGRDRDDHTWLQLVESESASRDGAAVNIYLRRRGYPDVENDNGPAKVYIRIDGGEDELEGLFEKIKNNGTDIKGGILVQPWGLREFSVEDLDGNIVNFSQVVRGLSSPVTAHAILI